LKAELPQLTHFSTLSPVPGFHRWLDRQLASPPEDGVFRPEEAAVLTAASAGIEDATEAFKVLLAEGWWQDPVREAALRPVLLRLAATYLTRPNSGMGGIDPVARFHLGNGARLERVNWLGNTSPRGLRESHGIMVNYLYDRESIEGNHERFIRSGQVARSAAVEALLAPVAAPKPGPSGRLTARLPRLLGGEEKPVVRPG
ncbi:MAG: Malonyl-CoA decarboxylase, partial [Belnapia sp.]|nr:Malonyl-CoA decarboxylase [Belnapia sp.]